MADVLTQEVVSSLPPEVIANLGFLINLVKAVGIVFLIYLIFLIVRSYLAIKHAIRIRSMDKTLKEMDEKLTKVIKSIEKPKSKKKSKN